MHKIAVLADIHGNLPALEAVLADIDAQRPDEVLVGGDLVGRGPQGSAVVRCIRERGWRAVRGNHEDYLLGFRRAGWDVLFLDRLEPGMGGAGAPGAGDPGRSEGAVWLHDLLSRFGLGEAYALLDGDGRSIRGRKREEVVSWLRDADLLLNFMGYLDDPELLAAAQRRVFVDLDPGFDQIWHDLGLADLYEGHDRFVTVGLAVGTERCAIPACGKSWIATLPPVVLSEWTPDSAPGDAFTSVVTWRGDFAPLEYRGRRYGLRAHEFRRFVDLPRRTGHRYELALDIHPADHADRARLEDGGWTLLDPRRVAGRPEAYRDFIRRSGAELQVAKGVYVETRSGWFSDRSACYLASGRPVLAQDTGVGERLPRGDGLLFFETLEDAVAGVDRIAAAPERHRRAAREIAVEHFASERVLPALLDALGAAPTAAPRDGARAPVPLDLAAGGLR